MWAWGERERLIVSLLHILYLNRKEREKLLRWFYTYPCFFVFRMHDE